MSSKPANSEVYVVGKGFVGEENCARVIEAFTDRVLNPQDNAKGFLAKVEEGDLEKFAKASVRVYRKQVIFVERNIWYWFLNVSFVCCQYLWRLHGV